MFCLTFRETGKTFHRFVTWQDLRSCDYVKKWNDSYSMRVRDLMILNLRLVCFNTRAHPRLASGFADLYDFGWTSVVDYEF